MSSNNQSNELIKQIVTVGDFVALNIIILTMWHWHWRMNSWPEGRAEMFVLVNNIAMMLALTRFSTVIHYRIVGAGEILRRILGLTIVQSVMTYVLLKVVDYDLEIGFFQWKVGTVFFAVLLVKRLAERWFIKLYRQAGRNTRTVTLVGNDPELMSVYEKLRNDVTLGYRVLGYYADSDMTDQLEKLGTMQEFLRVMDEEPDRLLLGDEMYVSLSRRDRDIIKRISRFCDHRVIRFFYVPVSVESIGLNLKREVLDDMEVFTTYELPLQNPVNKAIKRTFDVICSLIFLIPTAVMFPFIWAIIKIQSPGPLFFRQKRTGLDGKDFWMLKFRSMHVNKDADKLQATKDDPRKYPFGNFMRKSNIDELPQFLNILKGDMSFVGPRPHMLLHTEQYSKLIDKYMVRHFVKPGLTGWAQVTGFRGETRELWQMEGRVKRDIWYMEHWTIWLDIRIIWLTLKTIFVHDENAY